MPHGIPTPPGDSGTHTSRTPRAFLSRRLFVIAAPVIAALIILGVVAVQFTNLSGVHASSADAPVPFHVTLPAVVQKSHVVGQADVQQQISLAIGLRAQNEQELQAYVQDIIRPGSVNYHRYLTPAQYIGAFSPSATLYSQLQQYLQAQGFTITKTYNDRLLLGFSGTIAQAEHTFSVNINNYVAPDGHHYYANTNDPQLPAWLAAQTQSFSGLDDAVQLQHPLIKGHAVKQAITNSITCLGHDPNNQYLTSDQIASAYNLSGMYNAGYHGEGQAIALYELDGYSMSDLNAYESCYGHSHTAIQTLAVGTAPLPTSDAGVVEVELDAELVLSAAPQLGRLAIYEAANTEAGRLGEWAQIVNDDIPVVSTSWGLCEQLMAPQEVSTENTLFTAAVAQGQNIFAAAGDSGSAGCAFDNPGGSTITTLNAGDPGAQPYVTSVGGTTLTLSNSGGYGSEVTWNNPPATGYSGGASGGGISHYWTAPSWQVGPGVDNTYSSSSPCGSTTRICRETPDVSLQADPNNGYLVYCTPTQAGCSATQPWIAVGGTSAAAPMWAAMMALTNEMSLKQGGFNLGFLNPLLYNIGANATPYASSFHDITSGNNDFNHYNNGQYPASANYDLATGLGSYNAYNLATNLVALLATIMNTRVSPANTTWYFAEGSVGGGFQQYITLQNPSATQDATVNITYLFENKSSVTVSHTVAKSTRQTVSVNQDLHVQPTDPQQAVSTIVQVQSGGPGIVAERPMYFSYKGIASGTDVMGATHPQSTYYFPSVDARENGTSTYYPYITMLNPSSTQSASVTVTYYTGSCGLTNQSACPTQTVTLAPLHRGTATPMALKLYQQVSASVQSSLPIVVERPSYFKDNIPNAGGVTTGAASEVGATSPGTDWLFAEGYTGAGFQEYLELANFGNSAASATVTLEYDNGHRQAINVSVPALGHIYFDVNHANSSPSGTCDVSPCQTTNTSSAEVTSGAPIVVARLMYFHYGSNHISGGTETVGEAGPASNSVYAFAEGYTAGSFQEYLTLQNPTTTAETVAITLFTDGYVLQQQVVVAAKSRQTVFINPIVVPIATAYNNNGSKSFEVSLTVQALGTGAKIVAERPMYFNFHGDPGGTDVLGYTGANSCPVTRSAPMC